jgi:hypothetical protein
MQVALYATLLPLVLQKLRYQSIPPLYASLLHCLYYTCPFSTLAYTMW